MKLLCDHMLGSLARWLRLMGYDTAYPEPGPDRDLIDRARKEGRILLTRDKELAEHVKGLVPEAVRSRHQEFWRCPSCKRVYWQGSHWDKMVERLNHLDLPRAP